MKKISHPPHYHFAVTAAKFALPKAPVLLRCEIREQFEKAKELNYDAIELHLRTPQDVDPHELVALQNEFGIRVSAVATGLAKLIDNLCLIDPNAEARKAAVDRLKGFIDWSSIVGNAIILGSMRGNLPEDDTRAQSEAWIRETLTEVTSYAKEKKVVILLEVINRYENNYLNTAKETIDFVKSFHNEYLKVHLDTFHMNIEEADMPAAIQETGKDLLGYIHFADNNRHACGEGALDWVAIMQALVDIDYEGYASVECLCVPDGYTAAKNSIDYVKSLY